jgi:type II secretory pathway pseudopilin PulG
MSLVEMIVVLVLLGIIAVMGAPKIASLFKVSLQTTIREIASSYQEAYQSSLTGGKTYRLALDLDKEEYWIEEGPPDTLLETEKSREKREERERFLPDDEKQARAAKRDVFKISKLITRSKKTLPYGASFKQFERFGLKEPQTKGLAYIHLMPDGTSESAAIQLEDKDQNKMSLYFEAILGKTRMRNNHLSLNDWKADGNGQTGR